MIVIIIIILLRFNLRINTVECRLKLLLNNNTKPNNSTAIIYTIIYNIIILNVLANTHTERIIEK